MIKKWSIFEMKKYKILFQQNKIFFHKVYYKDNRKFKLERTMCNILYIHLLQFLKVETAFEEYGLNIILTIHNKDEKLMNKIKNLVLAYTRIR